ncbi:MAG: uroporphyrinogen decarboxylase [Gammaproteobacteria bacterium]
MNSNLTTSSLFLNTLKRQNTSRTPIWMMRQAGRYLPEYRALRSRVGGFLELCQTPELACEVTLQPINRFQLDAAIIFSDILVIPEAMGLGLHFVADHGPQFSKIPDPSEYGNLPVPDPEESLGYVLQTMAMVKHELKGKVPVIGFCGSPWTVATYIVEGKSTKQFSKIRALIYQNPKALHVLLNKLRQSSVLYLKAQVQHGADALMIFDTWGGLLGEPRYHEFSLNYMASIVSALKADPVTRDTPIILFSKNSGLFLEAMADTGCDALGLDWTCDISLARERVGERVALQGNLDPAILLSSPEVVSQEASALLKAYGTGSGHIFNLGHGIYPETPIENVEALIETVRSVSPAYHK